MSDRCIQCGWTIPERKIEVVLRGDPMDLHCETLLLHGDTSQHRKQIEQQKRAGNSR